MATGGYILQPPLELAKESQFWDTLSHKKMLFKNLLVWIALRVFSKITK